MSNQNLVVGISFRDSQMKSTATKEKQISSKHVEIKMNSKMHKCDICDKTLETKEYLVKHIRLYHKYVEKTNKCDFCGKNFNHRGNLLVHIKSIHLN